MSEATVKRNEAIKRVAIELAFAYWTGASLHVMTAEFLCEPGLKEQRLRTLAEKEWKKWKPAARFALGLPPIRTRSDKDRNVFSVDKTRKRAADCGVISLKGSRVAG